MSFSLQVKNELAHLDPERPCCRLAELSALTRGLGVIEISGQQRQAVHLATENAALARKIIRLFKALFELDLEVLVRKGSRLRKNNIYLVRVPDPGRTGEVLRRLGITTAGGRLIYGLGRALIGRACCRRSFLRGVFLAGGSVNSPEGEYHLELGISSEAYGEKLAALLKQERLDPRLAPRKGGYVLYLKEGEQVVRFLNIIGAHEALLHFENVRIYKDVRNRVNRLVNCETANLDKTVSAALRQVEDINLIGATIGLARLPARLRQLAEARLHYPEASLKELGESLDPPLSKSAVNHRMRKLQEIADHIRNQFTENS